MDIIKINNKEYIELENVNYNDNKYIILVNKSDNKDIFIRKDIIEDGEEYLETLDTEEEFDEVFRLATNKIKEKLGN